MSNTSRGSICFVIVVDSHYHTPASVPTHKCPGLPADLNHFLTDRCRSKISRRTVNLTISQSYIVCYLLVLQSVDPSIVIPYNNCPEDAENSDECLSDCGVVGKCLRTHISHGYLPKCISGQRLPDEQRKKESFELGNYKCWMPKNYVLENYLGIWNSYPISVNIPL